MVLTSGKRRWSTFAARSVAQLRSGILIPPVVLAVVLLAAAAGFLAAWLSWPDAEMMPTAKVVAAKNEAVRTAAIVAAGIGALFTLWLSDQRRHADTSQLELDRQRVADERFASAVDLLGNSAAPVRIGSMYALAGLARSRPELTQSVLDVLCAYLTQPFSSKDLRKLPNVTPTWTPTWEPGSFEPVDGPRRQELTVRRSAQLLIWQLLPAAPSSDDDETPSGSQLPEYELDLSGATLVNFSLSQRVVGWASFAGAEFVGNLDLTATLFYSYVTFKGARCQDAFDVRNAVFYGRLDLGGFSARLWRGIDGDDESVLLADNGEQELHEAGTWERMARVADLQLVPSKVPGFLQLSSSAADDTGTE